ncbi:MAG: TolC family protein [Ignavibacteria bacterium]|nr:TolC family protein [Ignavibacteria bacterium]
MKTLVACILVVGVMQVLIAQNRSETISQSGLTLAYCIDAALNKNPSVAAARFRVEAAEAKMFEAQTNRLPRLALSGRAARLSDVPTYAITLPGIGRQTLFESINHSYATRIALQQPIFTGFRLARLSEMSESQHDIASHEYRKAKNELVIEVSAAYWNLFKAIRLQKLYDQAQNQLRAHLADVQNLLGQGMASYLDVLRLEAQLVDLQMKIIEAGSGVMLASMRLSSLIGLDLLEPLVPADDAANNLPGPEDLRVQPRTLIAAAMSHRPEMHAMSQLKAIRERGVTVAQAGWFPQLSLSASYDYARPNQRVIPPSDRWEKTWDIGIVFQWSLWDWFETSYKVSEARAIESEARAQFDLLSNAIALDVVTQYRRLVEADALVTAGEHHVRRSEESRRVAAENFKQGVATSTEVLDAELDLLRAQLNHAIATVEAALQLQRFKMSRGEDLFE